MATRYSLLLLLLLLLGCVCLAASLPRSRRSQNGLILPGGISAELLFAGCEAQGGDGDIGPCLEELLNGAIDSARDNFTTGVRIKHDEDPIVLDPFGVDDIDPKDREFRFGAKNIRIYGIQGVQIDDIEFSPERLGLQVSFPELSAQAEMSLKYLFISANPNVTIKLDNPRVNVLANWTLEVSGDELYMVLSNATAKFVIQDLSVTIEKLSSLGVFLERILNKNSKIIIKLFVPDLEKSITKKLNKKLNRIRLRS